MTPEAMQKMEESAFTWLDIHYPIGIWEDEERADALENYKDGHAQGRESLKAELEGMGEEFSEIEAKEQTLLNQWAIECSQCDALLPDTKSFIRGARWQHQQSQLKIAALKQEVEELKKKEKEFWK